MFDIQSGQGRDIVLTYQKLDGSPGVLDGEPVVSLSLDGMAAVAAQLFDPVTGTLALEIEHNGATMEGLVLTVSADGDLGAGVHPIVWQETFNMKAPLGAVGVIANVSDERPVN